ncbi:hypothetical protein DM02DRAFT_658670 [Periconia macrospinosa]|uniref:Uncharacterized protein n=1 Tax=Periconia macrospinosa TaxID=97972 RepID=A0A2V1DG39_9PLEO|nr:hypothetical protein DM02DRAFT_658670 [Periconia macrospinosa]
MAVQPAGPGPYYANTTSIFNASSIAPSAALPSFLTTPVNRPSGLPGTATITKQPFPSPTGQPPPIGNSTLGSNSNTTTSALGNASCTVNIPNATLDWWFAATYELIIGTMTTKAPGFSNPGGYLTMVPNNATFDAAETISNQIALTETSTWDSEWGMYWTFYDLYPVTPTAAATSIVTRNTPIPLPSAHIIPQKDWPLYTRDPSNQLPASVSIAAVANSTVAATSATPFVHLTAYEVLSAVNGTISTSTVTLAQPSAFEYVVDGVESSASATGTVPNAFMQNIPQASCRPGVIYATVTVLIVLDTAYLNRPRWNPFIVHIESSALSFETDAPVDVNAQSTSGSIPFTVNWDFPSSGEITGGIGPQPTGPGRNLPDPQTPPGAEAQQHASDPAIGSSDKQGTNGNFLNHPQPTSQIVGSIGSIPIIVAPSSVVVAGTQTLKPGSVTTIDGSSVSLLPSATAIVVDGKTSQLPLVAQPGSSTFNVGSILGNPIVLGSTSDVVIAGQTLQPGAPAVTLGGNLVSLESSANAIIIGSKTSSLPQVLFPGAVAQTQAAAVPLITIGSSTYTANAATQYYIGPGQILTPGGTVDLGSTVVSLGPSASFVVVNGQTQTFPATVPANPTARPEIVLGGSTITAIDSTDISDQQDGPRVGPVFVVSGQTLTPGKEITVSGTTISFEQAGSAVIINGVTSTFAAPAAPGITPPPITIGQQIINPLGGSGISYNIDNKILTPGGIITISGTTISLAPDATALIINGVVSKISSSPLLTIGSNVYTAAPASGISYVIQGQTLTPGGTINLDGTTISLSPSATALVVNGVTTILSSSSKNREVITNPPILAIGSRKYTAAPGTGTSFIIDGQTLTPGGMIVSNGTTISLASEATELIFGSAGKSTTEMLFPATTTRSVAATGSNGGVFATEGGTGRVGQATSTSRAKGLAQGLSAPSVNILLLMLATVLISVLA